MAKGKGKKQAAKAGEVKAVGAKAEEVKVETYKDPYSSKVYASKAVFLAMKLAHTKTNFTKLHNELLAIVTSGKKEVMLDVSQIGMETMDSRLPRYVLGFINGGKEYKVVQDAKVWTKLTLTKKA